MTDNEVGIRPPLKIQSRLVNLTCSQMIAYYCKLVYLCSYLATHLSTLTKFILCVLFILCG